MLHYWKTKICLVFNGLPSANRRTLGKELVCRVLDPGALGKIKALGKITICRVSTLGKEIHSVNDHFAQCQYQAYHHTRQRLPEGNRRYHFAECLPLTLGKIRTLPSVSGRHQANRPVCLVSYRDTRQNIFSFFDFSFQFFSVALLLYLDQHVESWHNFMKFCYISLVYLISLNFFDKCKFELQV